MRSLKLSRNGGSKGLILRKNQRNSKLQLKLFEKQENSKALKVNNLAHHPRSAPNNLHPLTQIPRVLQKSKNM